MFARPSSISNALDSLPPAGDLLAIVLPPVVKSYITVSWNAIPGSLNRHDRKIDLLGKVEEGNNRNWLYNFYTWPGEYIVNHLGHD
ncbi:TcdA/TcdB pore forming domain-containing protein [Penicillium sp. IBT 35674x]|nr:TcdA/TcdB pore forming domain-containing protein [Penicillium sp. IBT 35674x]